MCLVPLRVSVLSFCKRSNLPDICIIVVCLMMTDIYILRLHTVLWFGTQYSSYTHITTFIFSYLSIKLFAIHYWSFIHLIICSDHRYSILFRSLIVCVIVLVFKTPIHFYSPAGKSFLILLVYSYFEGNHCLFSKQVLSIRYAWALSYVLAFL